MRRPASAQQGTLLLEEIDQSGRRLDVVFGNVVPDLVKVCPRLGKKPDAYIAKRGRRAESADFSTRTTRPYVPSILPGILPG
jgi:hypothetical protein